MATRTVQIRGLGFGSSPVTILATVNGNTVFNGTVATVDQPVPVLPDYGLLPGQEILFTFEIDTSFTGQLPMSCTVSNGTVIFGDVLANYCAIPNPVFSTEQYEIIVNPSSTLAQKNPIYEALANPPFSAEEIAILNNPASTPEQVNLLLSQHNLSTNVSSGQNGFSGIDNTDARSDVTIDGAAQIPDHGELPGTWWWTIENSSVLSYNLDVGPAFTG